MEVLFKWITEHVKYNVTVNGPTIIGNFMRSAITVKYYLINSTMAFRVTKVLDHCRSSHFLKQNSIYYLKLFT